MRHKFNLVLALGLVAGLAGLPAVVQAETARSEQAGKSEQASTAKKSQAASDDFEENRRMHMQKSKENNANKGAN